MHRNTVFLSVLLACLFGLSQQTTMSRRGFSFDKDTFSGSGAGVTSGRTGVTFEDDEDLADMSGSGSGSGEGSGKESGDIIISTYVATINISSQAYTPELADPTSQLFRITSKRIRQDLEDLFQNMPGEQTVTILAFTKGSLMTTFELQDTGNSHPDSAMKVLVDTLKDGRLGDNKVSTAGFAFKPVNTVVNKPRMTPTSTTSTTTTTSRPLTECERMKETRKRLAGSKYLPRCAPNGDFEALQCSKHAGTGDCWCSDLEGIEIPGTRMDAPNFPDCDDGYNMSPCVHEMVKHIRSRLVGSFRPRCALDGQFDRMQCHGSVCYCVDEDTGKSVDGTEVHIPATPNCDDEPPTPYETDEPETIPPAVNGIDRETDVEKEEPTKYTDKPTVMEVTREPEIIFPIDGKETIVVEEGGESQEVDVDIGSNGIGKNEVDIDEGPDQNQKEDRKDKGREENETGDDSKDQINNEAETKSRVKENEILTQPGLLGGIIGGSVVILLGLVLLIMFIVYRMRKKDEGSYPLDEPRKAPNYSYVRAPEKEYYA